MRNILLILSIVLLGSCSPCLYMAKHCPAVTVDTVTKTVTDSIAIHDTTFVIKTDTAVIHDTVPCSDFEKEFHSGRASIKIKVKDSVMTAVCICEGLEAKLQWYEHWHKEIIKHYHSEVRTAVIKEKKGFARMLQRFLGWFGYWQSWVCIFYVLLRLVRWILKMKGLWPFPISIKRSG